MSGGSRALEGRAIAELRHDLRTPLNHIIGYSEMLIEDAEDRGDTAATEALAGINTSAKELVGRIQNLLAPSRTEIASADVDQFRRELEAPLRKILETAGELVEAGDCAASDVDKIRVAAGQLMTFSTAGGGLQPPAQPEGAAAKPVAPENGSAAMGTGRILVVDDNASNRDLLSRRLERQGYSASQAENGRQALESIRSGEYDLVLLDIMMPEMDGYQVLEIMKHDPVLREIPVIMISALDELESMVRCIEFGAEDLLPKPFDPVLLRARVGACIEKKRLRDEQRRKTRELEETLHRLKQTQAQLVIQEKLASLGAVTAGIAHEIKNPLNFVTNFAEVSLELTKELREELPPEALQTVAGTLNDLDQSVQKISEHGKRADSIVRAMLLHSRGQSGEKQMTDINAMLAANASLAYHGLRAQDSSFNCSIVGDYDPAVGEIMVIPQDLSRVTLNIINNACYAVHQKSRKAGSGYAPTVSLSTRNSGGMVEIRIRDNGPGIPKDVLERIFDPFFTTKPAGVGTGLGLSISFDIVVEQHHGELKAESVEGEFAEFIIRLPKEAKSTEAQ